MKIRGFTGSVLLLSLGLVAGVGGSFYFFSNHPGLDPLKNNCFAQYPLTSRLIDCNTYDDVSSRLHNLNDQLKEMSDSYVAQGKADAVSVWVRDLSTMQWASSNETKRFSPASLMKLPLMIAYYRVAEIEPKILDAQIPFKPSTVLNSNSQDFPPADPLVPGKSYKVSDLIEHMIIHSDNDAAALLLSQIDQTVFENTLIDLGIKIPGNMQNYDFITVRSYGAIFRQLYNASYLNREYSQKALDLLSKTDFRGIQKGLPSDVTVADKFGEREINSGGENVQRELHDCGIIYKNTQPYTLCIMTSGKDFNDLISIIAGISAFVYQRL
jgi:beta-lactamase class A